MTRQINNTLKKIDWSLVIVYVILVITGWFNIYSAVYDDSASSIFDISQRYGKQMIWIITAFLFATIILIIDSGILYAFSSIFYIIICISLIGVFLFAPEIKGARSWFEIGALRIQPSEFAKLATSLVVAKYLGRHDTKITKLSDAIKVGILIMIPAALIVLQGDAGSAMVFAAFFFVFYREGMPLSILIFGIGIIIVFSMSIILGSTAVSSFIILVSLIFFLIIALQKRKRLPTITIFMVMLAFLVPLFIYFVFQMENKQVFFFMIGFIVVLIPLIMYTYKKRIRTLLYLFMVSIISVSLSQSVDYVFSNILEEHQQKRIKVFFGMESDPKGSEFNVIQSKIAIGSGDWTGKGFLNGTQTKNNFVPEQSTDFIFCTIGEEWGFIGSLIVIALFVFLILRILYKADLQRTKFSRIYGYCVASILFFHLLINIGMTIGLMPVIGIPLPFFSYGGSSLWGFTILLFIFIKLDSNKEELIQ